MIRLPYPPAACSPNARNLWAGIKARKKYRADCWAECLAQGLGKMQADRVAVSLVFRPKDKRRRDLDNALSSCKAGLDAVADVIGVDDSRWQIKIAWGEPAKPGIVEVTVE